MPKNEKCANRNEHQNRGTEVFWDKKRKTGLKNSQNCKTENLNVPLHNGLRKALPYWEYKQIYSSATITNFYGNDAFVELSKEGSLAFSISVNLFPPFPLISCIANVESDPARPLRWTSFRENLQRMISLKDVRN